MVMCDAAIGGLFARKKGSTSDDNGAGQQVWLWDPLGTGELPTQTKEEWIAAGKCEQLRSEMRSSDAAE